MPGVVKTIVEFRFHCPQSNVLFLTVYHVDIYLELFTYSRHRFDSYLIISKQKQSWWIDNGSQGTLGIFLSQLETVHFVMVFKQYLMI